MAGAAVVPVSGEASAMIRTITLVLVAASLAACSAEVWHRPGASQEDARADTAACQNAAQRSGDSSGVYRQVSAYNYFHRCMAARGYHASLY
jgi:outer membrane PBP1 activator LpoA protein